jgi:Transcriptional regulator/sugar kinase
MKSTPANNLDVRRANRNRVYRIIHANNGISRPEIALRLQVSLPTVMQNVKSLMQDGLVRENGNLDSTGGRKAVALSPVHDARRAIGIDITKTRTAAVLFNLDGTLEASKSISLAFSPDKRFVEKVGQLVDDLIDKSSVSRDRLIGAGVSVPGIISAAGDALIASYALPMDGDYLFEPLTKAISQPCRYINDANAAALAEAWRTGDPNGNFVYLSLSNSVGGAVVWQGTPRTGDNRRCGEFGHMTVERGGLRCCCGQRGCLDPYCAATTLSDRSNGDLAEFFSGLTHKEPKLVSAWDNYLDYLATAVNTLRMAFDYDIILGGYVGAHIEPHLGELRARVEQLNTFYDNGHFLKACRHKTEASASGAALLHIIEYIKEI